MGIMVTITLTFNHIITGVGSENGFAMRISTISCNAIKVRSHDNHSSHIFLAHEKFISLLSQALFSHMINVHNISFLPSPYPVVKDFSKLATYELYP